MLFRRHLLGPGRSHFPEAAKTARKTRGLPSAPMINDGVRSCWVNCSVWSIACPAGPPWSRSVYTASPA